MKKRELRWCYFEWWYSRWNRTGKPIKSIYIYSVVFVQFVEIIYWRLKNLHFKFCTRACKLATRPGCVFVPPDSDEGTTSRLSNVALTPARIFAPTKAVLHTDRGAPCIVWISKFKSIWILKYETKDRDQIWDGVLAMLCTCVCVCVCIYIYIEREREKAEIAVLPLAAEHICRFWYRESVRRLANRFPKQYKFSVL